MKYSSITLLTKTFIIFVLLMTSAYVRTPFFASIRPLDFWFVIVLSLILINREWYFKLKKQSFSNSKIIIFLLCIVISTVLLKELNFQYKKHKVLTSKPEILIPLGKHFIVGYRDENEIRTLISKSAVTGVFITARNVKNKTKEQIKQEIEEFQQIRKKQNLPPLLITTDQEGGIVSRLSPPLKYQSSLGEIANEKNIAKRQEAVVKYATEQVLELKSVGANVNFAPVVDLDYQINSVNDRYTKIYLRAISPNPQIVSEIGRIYTKVFLINDVYPTLKHFPGIGSINQDTHLISAHLKKSLDELHDDLLPFHEILDQTQSFIMLSHVTLDAIDPQTPVSNSEKVISQLVRKNWPNHILVTDDFSMGAIFNHPDKISGSTVKAINAGVDLILISFDTDLYYEAMDALLVARKMERVNQTIIKQSQSRLENLKLNYSD